MGKASRRKKERRNARNLSLQEINGKYLKVIQEEARRTRELDAQNYPDDLPEIKLCNSEEHDAVIWREDYARRPMPWRRMQANLNDLRDIETEVGDSAPASLTGTIQFLEALLCALTKGDIDWKKLRRAGHLLNEVGGIDLMHEVCSSAPRETWRCIDLAWDGIGAWLA